MFTEAEVYEILPQYEQETGRVIHSQDNHNHAIIGVVISFGLHVVQCIKKVPLREPLKQPKEVLLRAFMIEACSVVREQVEAEGFK